MLRRAGMDPAQRGWSTDPGGPPSFDPDDLGSPAMQAAGHFLPTRVYPLFENALRHTGGEPRPPRPYVVFSRVAVANPAAWSPAVRTAEAIPRSAGRCDLAPYRGVSESVGAPVACRVDRSPVHRAGVE